ncbi:MAG: ComEC/Rec2 family competence protein [Actinobacteria bacterium]|nr:ComEC/Rec2 family competence protein [Actinomycetota bacterium]
MTPAAVSRIYPHCLPGALSAGLAFSVLARMPSVLVGAVGVALAAALTLGASDPRVRLAGILAGLLCAGWWWGSVRLQGLDESGLVQYVGLVEEASVVVTGPVRRSPFNLRMPARLERFGGAPVAEPVWLKLPLGRAPPQGGLLILRGKLEPPRPAQDGFDERAWLRRQGIHAVLDGGRWQLVGHRGGLAGMSDRVRAWLSGSLAPGLEGERRAIIAGIVLGADEGLSEQLRDRFRASGLYHLLAVSGQNVVFLAVGILFLAWVIGIPRLLGEIGVLAAITGYVFAVGWQPSVVRAGVAGCLASLAWLASRPRDRWYFLLVGAVVLLAWNPYNLEEPGFQLSFAAVAAIFVLVPRVERTLEGYPVPRPLVGVIAVSAACGLATAPILWVQFDAVPVFSVVGNALATPVVAPLLGIGLLTALLEPVLPAGAASLAWVNGWLAAYLAACARLVGGLPHAQVSSLAGVALLLGLPGAAIVLYRLRTPRAPRVIILAGTAALAFGGWQLWPPGPPLQPPAGLRLTFLDVGQGDAVLIQSPEGALLVDQGPPEGDVAGQLRRLGIRRLAALVLTHPQRDHVGGAADVLRAVPVDVILDPKLPVDSPDERAALAVARTGRVPITLARAGQTFRLGKLRVRVLWPDGPGPPGDDPNRWATVLLVSYGDVDALLTADAESDVTVPVRPPAVEILKVAHHGSADERLPRCSGSCTPTWL